MDATLQNILFYAQIIVSALIVISVLLQNRAEGLGKMFGGGGEVYRTKRGFDKFLYYATMFLALVLVVLSLVLVKYS